jgi:hypothetical protein
MTSRVRKTQLNLLGTLPAARIDLTFHMEDGVAQRQWWISAVDDEENQILLWSDSTSQGPHGGLNLAELLTQLLEVLRLARGPSDPSQ